MVGLIDFVISMFFWRPLYQSLPFPHFIFVSLVVVLWTRAHLSERCGNTVTTSVATTYHNHILVLGKQMRVVYVVTHLFLLPALQECHSEVDAFQLPARNGQVSRPCCTRTQEHRIILLIQVLQGNNRISEVKTSLGALSKYLVGIGLD